MIKKIEDLPYGHFPDSNVVKAKLKAATSIYKQGDEIKIVRFGSMGCYDKHHNYIDFYKLDFNI